MKLERTEEWTKDKPQTQALFSAYLVSFAETLYPIYYGIEHDSAFPKIFSNEDKAAWLNAYMDITSEFNKNVIPLLNLIKTLFPQHKNVTSKIDKLRKAKSPSTINDLANCVYEFAGEPSVSIQSEQRLDREKLLQIWSSFLQYPLVVFMLKVFFPCVLLYQSIPQILLRKALKGDIDSLEKLLALDKNIITTIPKIEKIWEQENRDTKSARFKRLQKALGRSPYKKITPTRIKTVIAAGIEFIFKLSGKEISRPEIRKLFDAYAQDTNKGQIDTDLPDTPDGFNRAINRETKKFIRTHQTVLNS